ncbi:preprotein translocase subunit SecA [Psychrilyobacter atlanticus]|uniref:preprotein translocase subunit SecA n=1 Tax=Psychrilyobacter atlanticus TaxID=271091 RepID=UPI000409888B|nr:preprotein translocase subunit SecA [Psychrilyobacter atlanticus]
MIGNLVKKIFGTKNDREIKRILAIVDEINNLEPEIKKLGDEDLKAKTIEFRERLDKGETLDDILAEAFAVVREGAIRVLEMRHYDVQMIGGVVLHEGKITEMKTGEGKTLVATLAVYLNALNGKGVHVVTVNDYLATRDRELMGRLYDFLGLTSDVLYNNMPMDKRGAAYRADITYGTNSEFGFDYLRDNMVSRVENRVQRDLHFCIVDEVDSILIDEARTPLIISGAAADTQKWYKVFDGVSKKLVRSYETEKIKDIKKKKEMNIPDDVWKDYEVDEKSSNITLTEKGIAKIEKELDIENLYSPENVELTHYMMQALKAKELFYRDKEYLVRDGQIVIIDEFTGRAMEGRRYSDGLHQALEAKEGLKVAGENQTLASITLQNYFRMYEKLSGMTGTAETEAPEFMHTYKLGVVVIPTNRPIVRMDNPDLVYKTHDEKINAIIERIEELYTNGQPALVGTISIESSEVLSERLKKRKIPHEVLNAKFHEKEADIVAQAGRYKSITIATNMAGRGTDIMLGGNPEFLTLDEVGTIDDPNYEEVLEKYKAQCADEKVKVLEAGGLFILGTERHESRRIDNQLRGRSGRQGDPGATEFYLSLEDELMRLFGSERVAAVMDKLGLPEGEPIVHSMISKAIENAQKKVEARNFGIRKNLLEFDDVNNKQREAIYESRNTALEKDDLSETVFGMLTDTVSCEVVEKFVGEFKEDWDIDGLVEKIEELFDYVIEDKEEYKSLTIEEYSDSLSEKIVEKYKAKEEEFSTELMRKLEKYILFEIVDSRWREHLKTLDALREGIYLRSYGQKDPLTEYKLISGDLYAKMLKTIKEETISYLFKVQIRVPEEREVEIKEAKNRNKNIRYEANDDSEGNTDSAKESRVSDKVGRNDLCPCGSGKKYKKCCGRV